MNISPINFISFGKKSMGINIPRQNAIQPTKEICDTTDFSNTNNKLAAIHSGVTIGEKMYKELYNNFDSLIYQFNFERAMKKGINKFSQIPIEVKDIHTLPYDVIKNFGNNNSHLTTISGKFKGDSPTHVMYLYKPVCLEFGIPIHFSNEEKGQVLATYVADIASEYTRAIINEKSEQYNGIKKYCPGNTQIIEDASRNLMNSLCCDYITDNDNNFDFQIEMLAKKLSPETDYDVEILSSAIKHWIVEESSKELAANKAAKKILDTYKGNPVIKEIKNRNIKVYEYINKSLTQGN